MDFTDKGWILHRVNVKHILQGFYNEFLFSYVYPEEAKVAKAEVNLMSLLSTLEDIPVLQPAVEETEESKEKEEAPKLPRTNSLEDLGVKVLPFVFFSLTI